MYTLNTMIKCNNPTKTKDGRVFPCGQCITCRKSRMLEWNVRGFHHLQTEKKASFITLTYKTRFLPKNNGESTLKHEDFQKFMKRTRKHFKNKHLSYIMCGEYGENGTQRPHYHAVIYGVDRKEWSEEDLSKLWGKGRVDLSKLPFSGNAIEYVTGYVRKKLLDRRGKREYLAKNKKPPYQITSKGIGKKWCINNFDLWGNNLSIASKYGNVPVPRYYIKTIKKIEGVTYKFNKICTTRIPEHYYKGGFSFSWGTRENKVDIRTNIVRYKMIENVFGEKTQIINKAIYKNHLRKYEQLEEVALKLDDSFYWLGKLREEKEDFWKWLYNKAREYVLWFGKEKEFIRFHEQTGKSDDYKYFQDLAWKKYLYAKKVNPEVPAEVANFARTKKDRETNGLFGLRNKVRDYD